MDACPGSGFQTQAHPRVALIMYTDRCRTSQEGSYFVKFSDDTAPLTLLQGQDSGHGQALPAFTKWCDDHHLDLNVSKTKELITDFRQSQDTPIASTIHNEEVQIVDSYKYFGTFFDSQLSFKENTELIVKWGQQRTFICWCNGLYVKEKNSLNTIVKVCFKIIGIQQRNLGTIWEKQAAEKAKTIISQPDHIMLTEFLLLLSGRRYNLPRSKSNQR